MYHYPFWSTPYDSTCSDHVEPRTSYVSYSSARKAHNPFLPSNIHGTHESVRGVFDVSNLPQTDIMYVFNNNLREPKLQSPYEVSLAKTLSPTFRSVGSIQDSNARSLGTCTLISNNFALVARHTIADMQDIRGFSARFDYFNGSNGSHSYRFMNIIEESAELDYAIVQLSGEPGAIHGHMKLSPDSASGLSELALLHHPDGKPLKVSANAVTHSDYETENLQIFHDTDYCSSGGAYISPDGLCVALHLGCEPEQGTLLTPNTARYAIEISKIIRNNPNSVLAKIIRKEITPTQSYSWLEQTYFLPPATQTNVDWEKNRNSMRRFHEKEKREAEKRAQKRLERFGDNWEQKNGRDLMSSFPQLGGPRIFGASSARHTTTNKTVYTNPSTGWQLCYDKGADYYTVIDEHGRHVAEDGDKSTSGADGKYHFLNYSR